MPSFQDSALIFFIALLLFGPKKLPELARQLGKLMGEFRRASNDFRVQMEDELRLAEQTEQKKKIAAMQAAAPVAPLPAEALAETVAEAEQPHTAFLDPLPAAEPQAVSEELRAARTASAPLPISTSGELSIMPPSTGLPTGRSSLAALIDAVPREVEPLAPAAKADGNDFASSHLPDRKTAHRADDALSSEAPLHG